MRTFKKFSYLRELKRNPRAYGRDGRKATILTLIFTIFLWVMSILSPGSGGIPVAGWFSIAIAVGLILLEVWHYRNKRGLNYTGKYHKKVTEGLLAKGQLYTFRESEFDAETCVPGNVSKSTVSYNTLHSVEEDQDTFYLYPNEQGAHIIDKHGFKTGTPEEFRNLLIKNLPPENCKISYPTT